VEEWRPGATGIHQTCQPSIFIHEWSHEVPEHKLYFKISFTLWVANYVRFIITVTI